MQTGLHADKTISWNVEHIHITLTCFICFLQYTQKAGRHWDQRNHQAGWIFGKYVFMAMLS